MRIPRTIIALLGAFMLVSATRPEIQVQDYIDQYSKLAVKEMHRTGIPASIKLAQAIIESRFGNSGLSQKSNNHFGIKCGKDWQNEGFYAEDDDYENGKLMKSCFRTYATPEESFYDHSNFLLTNQRYSNLFLLDKTDYKGWAKGLKESGYATAPDYTKSLIATIEKYKLNRFDSIDGPVSPDSELVLSLNSNENEIIEGHAAPPSAQFISEDYRIGDGLKKQEAIEQNNFYRDVYGSYASEKYLDEITPMSRK